MSLLDILKDKFTDVELKAKIQKELRESTLNAVQKYKGHPAVEAGLIQGAIGNLYTQPTRPNYNIDEIVEKVISHERFQRMLEDKITEVILSLVTSTSSNEAKPSIEDKNALANEKTIDTDVNTTYIDTNDIQYFDKLQACEEAKQKGIVVTHEEESEFLLQLMEIEDDLIQEERLCPHCHALDMIRNGVCLVCKNKI